MFSSRDEAREYFTKSTRSAIRQELCYQKLPQFIEQRNGIVTLRQMKTFLNDLDGKISNRALKKLLENLGFTRKRAKIFNPAAIRP